MDFFKNLNYQEFFVKKGMFKKMFSKLDIEVCFSIRIFLFLYNYNFLVKMKDGED